MGLAIINPGTGPTEDCGFEQAYENIRQLIKDSGIDFKITNTKGKPDEELDGRYWFELALKETDAIKINVYMPALPLEKVRFLHKADQNIWDFPRLYVDGSSWVWYFAINILRDVVEDIEGLIEEKQEEIKDLKKIAKKLRTKRNSLIKKGAE